VEEINRVRCIQIANHKNCFELEVAQYFQPELANGDRQGVARAVPYAAGTVIASRTKQITQ